MLNIRTRIRTNLNPSKRIRSRIRSENIRTVFIPAIKHDMWSPETQEDVNVQIASHRKEHTYPCMVSFMLFQNEVFFNSNHWGTTLLLLIPPVPDRWHTHSHYVRVSMVSGPHCTACSSRARPEHRAALHLHAACRLRTWSRITMLAGPTARWQEALSARPRASKSQSRTNPKSHNPPDPRDPWAPGPTGLWTLQRLLFSTKGAPGL
jgi:hypothetical protein